VDDIRTVAFFAIVQKEIQYVPFWNILPRLSFLQAGHGARQGKARQRGSKNK
jgi:hypothetical protein